MANLTNATSDRESNIASHKLDGRSVMLEVVRTKGLTRK